MSHSSSPAQEISFIILVPTKLSSSKIDKNVYSFIFTINKKFFTTYKSNYEPDELNYYGSSRSWKNI